VPLFAAEEAGLGQFLIDAVSGVMADATAVPARHLWQASTRTRTSKNQREDGCMHAWAGMYRCTRKKACMHMHADMSIHIYTVTWLRGVPQPSKHATAAAKRHRTRGCTDESSS
jgi:hypothetical protein